VGVKGVRAIRCPHLCCQLMPDHCEGSSRKRTESPRKVLPCGARRRRGQKGQEIGKKQGRRKKSTTDGYWCEFSTGFRASTPLPVHPRWLSVDGNPAKSLPP